MHNTHAAFKDTYRDRQVFPITKQSFEMLHGIFLQGLSTYRLTVLKKRRDRDIKDGGNKQTMPQVKLKPVK